MKPKISIMGCGWLGLPLSIHLVKEGYSVKGSTTTVNKIEKLESLGIRSYLVDLGALKDNILSFLCSDVLIISLTSKHIQDFEKLVSKIEKSEIKKVIFISSTSVYHNTNGIVTEETVIKPSPLSSIEQLFINNSELNTTVIRFAGLYGYDRKPGNFVPRNKNMDHPEGFVNMIHRDDCIQIIKQVIEKEVWGEIINACTDGHPTRREFYTQETQELGLEAPVFNENSSNDHKIVSNKKLKSLLAYTFKYTL